MPPDWNKIASVRRGKGGVIPFEPTAGTELIDIIPESLHLCTSGSTVIHSLGVHPACYADDGITRDSSQGIWLFVESGTCTLKHESLTGPIATNRFKNTTGSDLVISADQRCHVMWMPGAKRWVPGPVIG